MLEPALQAAGHPGAHQGNGSFIKPSSQTEIAFYQKVLDTDSPLKDHIPTFMGVLTPGLLSQLSSTVSAETLNALGATTPQDPEQYIVLQDLTQFYSQPCIADIKLGAILWTPEAPESKINRLKKVASSTTSGSLGFRIAGMTVYDPGTQSRKAYPKEYGRTLTQDNVIEGLLEFLPKDADRRRDVALKLLVDMEDLYKTLQTVNVEFHSSSVLLIYDGDPDGANELLKNLDSSDDDSENCSLDEGIASKNEEIHKDSLPPSRPDDLEAPMELWGCHLIDFTNARFTDKPCSDLLNGLKNLIQEMKKCCK